MIQLYDPQSGGSFSFSYDTSIPAVSGFATVYGSRKVIYHFSGTLSSGSVIFYNIDFVEIPTGVYLVIPRVIDTNEEIYFLPPEDLEVINVPIDEV